jgi:hypothetical protein
MVEEYLASKKTVPIQLIVSHIHNKIRKKGINSTNVKAELQVAYDSFMNDGEFRALMGWLMDNDVLDKFDADEAVDQYADMVGAPPSIIVPDDKVQEARQARAQRQQMAENAQMAAQVAPAMKQGAEAAAVMAEARNAPGGQGLLSQLGISG